MRYVIVHMDSPIVAEGLNAHAFGPFASLAEAQAFAAEGAPDDTCVQLMMPIVGPGILDILVANPEDRVVGISIPEDHDAKTH